MKDASKLLYPELSYLITGLCYQVQNKLGRFCKEKQYSDEFERLLINNKVGYKREIKLNKVKTGSPFGNQADFIIENTILIDFKAKKFVTKEDYYQMQRYLQCSGLELGLVVNFRNTYLKPKRILNTSMHSASHSDRIYSDHSDV